ncbi:Mu transposase C-terminal domain-containing protein [Streptomyces olivoreticuli]|uniref:Mu transposase C-terminal domain-containing protein n=1 Tax=Streptomyces olivoreticuli TaxID=68246 RepID=UPI0026596F6E|nr:Mu transposase C-terminal domain-containing protein [Streptomyces olivoreticuli]WKK21916.1 Mu transposase C-terminal domain-containing protein [Streptomyces olivoreticuli]WKK26928.1 Mu transposase C-terminal domain-containing protein [Streptomyces olivoreticuli]
MNAHRLHRLTVCDWIEFDDERHQVTSLDGALVRLRSETGRIQTAMLSAVLTDASFRAGITPPPPKEQQGEELAADPDGVLAGLQGPVRDAALQMEGHLWEVRTGYRSGNPLDAEPGEPREDYDPGLPMAVRLENKARELGLTRRRIEQLRKEYGERGLWALVDKRKAQISNPLRNLDPRIIQAIRDQDEAQRHSSSTTVGGAFYRRTQNRLDTQYGPGEVVLPSRDRFRRMVALLLDKSPAAPAYQRASAANQPDRPFGHVIAHRPGEVVMLDTTPLDVLAYDPATGAVLRVELTVALDIATRCLLSWCLTPEGTKAIDIGLLLADVMTPEVMRPHWADALRFSMLRVPYERLLEADERLAEAAARPVIYPETLLYDHGKPYASKVMARACLKWKIDIQDARQLKPTDKPHVERLFHTVRVQFSEHVAGYKGFNVAHRGKDADAQARWTIDELTEFFAEYVIAVYQRTSHRGLILPGFPDLHTCPNEAYTMALGSAGYVDCPREANTYFELLPIARRRIHPYGIELNSLIYNAPILYRYRKSRSPYPGGLWPIRYDPRNLLHAYFFDPADGPTGRWHTLRWSHALAEHQPFTDITLREAKRLLELRGATPADQDAVAEALWSLQNRTDAPELWTSAARKRLPRDAHRAAAQARDLARAAAPVDEHLPLTLVPAPGPLPDDHEDGEESEDFGIDLTSITPAEIWDPHAEEAGEEEEGDR